MSGIGRVFIFGDSHAQPMVDALTGWKFLGPAGNELIFANNVDCGINAYDLVIMSDRGQVINPVLQVCLERGGLLDRFTGQYRPEGSLIGLQFGYSYVHTLGLSQEVFAGVDLGLLLEGPSKPSGAVHFSMFKELMRRRLDRASKAIDILKEAGFKVFLLAGPPPASDQTVQEHHPLIKTNSFGSRRLVWIATQDIMSELSERHSVLLLTDQSRFMDAQGVLLPQYASDGIHANWRHGLAYLSDICSGLGFDPEPVRR